jgi:ubiquinone/menaquinone biosynthesis C-methylase UbiE
MSVFYSRFAEYYDALYSFKDYKTESETLRKIIEAHKRSDGNTLLDVACGTGGHIQYLRQYYTTWGIDVSNEMLDVARMKFNGVEFRHADMTDFDLKRGFDVVVCLFGSINYLTTKEAFRKAVANFSKHTVEGGVLVMEPIFTKERMHSFSIGMQCVDEAEYKLSRVNSTLVAGDIAYLNFHFLLATRDGVEHIFDPSPLGVFSESEFMSAMEDSGYQIVDDKTGISKQSMFVGVKE